MSKYFTNIFEVQPRSFAFTSEQNTQVLPLIHRDYQIVNIGKVPVRAEVQFGTSAGWTGIVVGPIEIKPGEEAVFDMSRHMYFMTTVKVYNESPIRALVFVGKDDGSDWNQKAKAPLKLNITTISQELVKFGPGSIPIVGDKLDQIIDFFWPQKNAFWSLVVDQDVQLQPKVKNDLRQIRTRVINLNILLEHKDVITGPSFPYQFMQLMKDLVGFEKKFILNHDIAKADYNNLLFLPYYSSIVSLKLCLYQYGVINRSKIGLNDEQVRDLLSLSKQLIEDRVEGAEAYVHLLLTQALTNEYAVCDPQLVFDSIATIRTFWGLAGGEYLAYWAGILTNPFWKKKAYNDVITFSTYFGRPSPQLVKQLVQEEVSEPLQPILINGIRNKMVRVDIWTWRKNSKSLPKVGGISVYFSNGNSYNLGHLSQEVRSISFKDAYLTKLTAWGDGAIDCLEFTLSDGRKELCGTKDNNEVPQHDFELENHHIAGIFLGDDVPLLQGQAANITVSYQLTTEPSIADL